MALKWKTWWQEIAGFLATWVVCGHRVCVQIEPIHTCHRSLECLVVSHGCSATELQPSGRLVGAKAACPCGVANGEWLGRIASFLPMELCERSHRSLDALEKVFMVKSQDWLVLQAGFPRMYGLLAAEKLIDSRIRYNTLLCFLCEFQGWNCRDGNPLCGGTDWCGPKSYGLFTWHWYDHWSLSDVQDIR